MPRHALIIAILCSIHAAPASAAELTGFGPIKFGMTKKEAISATGGTGEWITPEFLKYELPSFDDIGTFVVEQKFERGRAADAFVEYHQSRVGSDGCLTRGLRFAGEIQRKYVSTPTVRYGAERLVNPVSDKSYMIQDIYAFNFGRNAFVDMIVKYYFEKSSCWIYMSYRAPNAAASPF